MKNLFITLGLSVWVASFAFALYAFTSEYQEAQAQINTTYKVAQTSAELL